MQNQDSVNTKYFPLKVITDNDPVDVIVRDLLSDKLGLDFHTVDDEASLKDDLGIDSLDFTEFIMELEKKFKIDITDEETEKLRKVKDITLLITQKI
jgi:acyl carrier protein